MNSTRTTLAELAEPFTAAQEELQKAINDTEAPYAEWTARVSAAHLALADLYYTAATCPEVVPGSLVHAALIDALVAHRGRAEAVTSQ
ncbi:MAG: hypothetical protein JOZ47_14035 [Kutzneria sp.]|nr:hypothetical protein [Kutzneria sp.]MBV9846171.1 hypothetical protein [Kutzneria sp.]